jgi:hypothetical protein
MLKIRYIFIVLGLLLYSATSSADVSVRIGLPHVSIGINLPAYPELVPVPGYPVYYAPRLQANYFFYDGMYWVYQNDNWYASSWYNGPWQLVEPAYVPVFILRIPVRYYRRPPVYFHGWRPDAPPRWGEHWGPGWEQHNRGWDKWDHRTTYKPAPLPTYQRQYSKDRYPRQLEQQQKLQTQHYRYQPRDPVVRQHYQERAVPQQKRNEVQDRRQQQKQDQHKQQSPGSRGRQDKQPGKDAERDSKGKRGQNRDRDE